MTGRDANPLDLDTVINDSYSRRTATASTQVTPLVLSLYINPSP